MNHLIDFGVCALVGCTHHIILRNYFRRYFKCILGVQIRCYIVRAELLGERPKGKYSTAKQLNGPRGFEIVLQLEKCHLFRCTSRNKVYLFLSIHLNKCIEL